LDIRPATRSSEWNVPQKQLDVISNSSIPLFEKEKAIMLANRDTLWKEGDVNDIKKGEYFAKSRVVNDKESNYPELYDNFTDETLRGGHVVRVGWSRGLSDNITMKLNGKNILVMDNHYFAAAFIIEMMGSEVLQPKSFMMHFDEHSDMGRGPDFSCSMYVGLKTAAEKIAFLNQNAGIGGWIEGPLMDSGRLDNFGYLWVLLNEKNLHWTTGIPKCTDSWHRQGELTEIKKMAEITVKDKIVDVDIDVLLPIENGLTQTEKDNILKGFIPRLLEERLRDIADAASFARVVTIATSPAYIVQDRAIVYVKKLLEFMGA
jgi:hypothetical protein